ncbi:hypothetical protein [Desulfovibrio inopinatus]|uniref:hypothetical protein n=1 Tax=Desulfovibrio inopinatus TaxID=102109 RepID=UPI0003F6CB32|nr:hypothetical protein [Desulfovibrio inopinatus]
MKSSDVFIALAIVLACIGFTVIPETSPTVGAFVQEHGFFMSFLKFAVLCTLGELIALRITSKKYTRPGFGLLPRCLMWGLIGILVHVSFIIYVTGTPMLLEALGVSSLFGSMGGFGSQLLLAFSISVLLNTLFAPLFMAAHSVVDMHIESTGGTLKGFLSPIPVSRFLGNIDWNMLWGFVFKKTIPFFWIPAHTITFLLPPEVRIVFAAILGVALGVILAFASLKSAENVCEGRA